MIVKKNQFLSIFFYLISFVLMIFAIFIEAEEAVKAGFNLTHLAG